MNRKVLILGLVGFLSMMSAGCHHLANDFGSYLANDPLLPMATKADFQTAYYLTPETSSHSYSFRAFTSGIANKWIVEFGSMLDTALESPSVQAAFGKLTKQATADSAQGNLLIFDLKSYEFSEFTAHVALNVKLMKGSQTLLDKLYSSDGLSQGGKMFWGGAFSVRNAVHQSTRYALDDILRKLLRDIKELNTESNTGSSSS